jgi:predicted nucleic acid-binding protein
MTLFADTNWLVAAYFDKADANRSAIVQRFGARTDSPWIISAVVLMECANTFPALAGEPNPEAWRELQRDIGRRVWLLDAGWSAIAANADDLISRFSHRARLGTLDLMILASALKCGATHFLSFDTNSSARALAAVLKLKVVPELTELDRRRMQFFRENSLRGGQGLNPPRARRGSA